jgi:uncharacterized membrane protein YcaP (DUF421 family)
MFFENWFSLLRIIVVGTVAYASLILFVRLFGKRTLSKMSAFDLVVTVALGSTLATVILSKDVKLAEGALALLLLCTLQFVVAALATRWRTIERIVKSDPKLLFYQGNFIESAMGHERITRVEVYAAMRSQGIGDLDAVYAAILEADGSISIVNDPPAERSILPPA